MGVVRALDVDSGHGTNTSIGRFLADHLVRLARTDHPALGRGAYVISDRHIASATSGWTWRRYGGYNRTSPICTFPCPWASPATTRASPGGWAARHHRTQVRPTIRRGFSGPAVRELQQVLNKWYPSLPPLAEDGMFGEQTEDRVKHFQRHSGIVADGVVGPITWSRLGFASPLVAQVHTIEGRA